MWSPFVIGKNNFSLCNHEPWCNISWGEITFMNQFQFRSHNHVKYLLFVTCQIPKHWIKPLPKLFNVTISFLNIVRKSIWNYHYFRKFSCPPHHPHQRHVHQRMIPCKSIRRNSNHSQNKKNNNVQTIYVCIMENHVTFLAIVQRSKCNTHPRPLLSTPSWRFWKWGCLVSIRIVKLDFDASCDWNGPNLFSNPTFCLLFLIAIKCNKSMTMKTKMFFFLVHLHFHW
jgi:hypothetical protein